MAMDISRRGLLLILSSPSGAGKTTISRAILEGDAGIELSVSVTTRPPRPGEVDGEDYHFIDEPAFRRMVAEGLLLEHALVFGNSYGTPRDAVEKAVTAGRDVLFDVDWQGTQQLTENARGDVASIFVLPPSMAALEDRLRYRAQDADTEVAKRMSEAEAEMSHWPEYDYVIVNRDFERSVQAVQTILAAERLRRERQVGLTDFIGAMRLR
ncbi:MAG: guanylate kinase [Rhodospirillales bacterium]|jgi:guanylate kinase|nr:guanylate kinase [Rhodospirillales bacterium]